MVSQHLRVNLEAAVVDSLHLLFCCFLPELQHELVPTARAKGSGDVIAGMQIVAGTATFRCSAPHSFP